MTANGSEQRFDGSGLVFCRPDETQPGEEEYQSETTHHCRVSNATHLYQQVSCVYQCANAQYGKYAPENSFQIHRFLFILVMVWERERAIPIRYRPLHSYRIPDLFDLTAFWYILRV